MEESAVAVEVEEVAATSAGNMESAQYHLAPPPVSGDLALQLAACSLHSTPVGGRQCVAQSARPESLLRSSCREEDEDFSWSNEPRPQVLHEGLVEARTRSSKMTKHVVPVIPPHSSEGDGQTFPQSFKVKGS